MKVIVRGGKTRRQMQITLTEVARLFRGGVSRQWIYEIETSSRRPRDGTVAEYKAAVKAAVEKWANAARIIARIREEEEVSAGPDTNSEPTATDVGEFANHKITRGNRRGSR